MNRRVFPAICCRQPGKVKFDPVVRMLSVLSSVFFFPGAKRLEVRKKRATATGAAVKIACAV